MRVLSSVPHSHRNVLGWFLGALGRSRDGLRMSRQVRRLFLASSGMCARACPASSAPSTVGVDGAPPATSRSSLVLERSRDHFQLAAEDDSVSLRRALARLLVARGLRVEGERRSPQIFHCLILADPSVREKAPRIEKHPEAVPTTSNSLGV
jgi:hypothetical protein